MNKQDFVENRQQADARGWSPAVWGTIYGAVSALAYTAANICLRSVTEQDPVWVSSMKAVPTLVGTSLWLWLWPRPAERIFPPVKVIGMLVGAALVGHVGGNVVFQWALGVIGIALTVPLCMGAVIIGSAVLGRLFLGESVTPRTFGALAALVAAIWILSLGARGAASVAMLLESETTGLVTLAVMAACIAGLSYAVLGVAIRRAVLAQASVAATTFCVSIVGLLSLGPAAVVRLGLEQLGQTPAPDLVMMLFAGVFNLVAFVALTRALQITTLVYVNALNASQVALAAMAGVIFFGEQLSTALVVGAGLTIAGLLLLPRPETRRR